MINFKNQKGVTALLTVLIISSSALILALMSSSFGLGDLSSSFLLSEADRTMALTEGCAEEALRQIKINSGYTGESLSLENGSCIINVSLDGSNRTIEVVGSVNNYQKKIEIEITLSGNQIIINSWKEVEE